MLPKIGGPEDVVCLQKLIAACQIGVFAFSVKFFPEEVVVSKWAFFW